MEDGLLGAESLEHSMNLTPKGGSKEVDDQRPSGFINHLLSNLVSGGEGQEEKAGEKVDEEKRGIVSEEGVDHEDKGGGFISHLISNLVSSHSPKAGKDREQKVEAFEGDNGALKQRKMQSKEKSGGGGIIENLVSHLPAPLQEKEEEERKPFFTLEPRVLTGEHFLGEKNTGEEENGTGGGPIGGRTAAV
ncbi:hypothetical protein I3842_09G216200 [Carya illinoinensis]|uniref:Uncharacterized protein n=1 Tax=Carya illinoinensis TaxID=32201 RepID=A0A922J7Y6_CARIL|nr:hypothetical protein I3842_09G216200 [Carya illinoinensis]